MSYQIVKHRRIAKQKKVNIKVNKKIKKIKVASGEVEDTKDESKQVYDESRTDHLFSTYDLFQCRKVLRDLNLTRLEIILWLVIRAYACLNKECWPSLDTLCSDTGAHRTNIVKAIHKLESLGLVTKLRRPRRSTIYSLVGLSVRSQKKKPLKKTDQQVGTSAKGSVEECSLNYYTQEKISEESDSYETDQSSEERTNQATEVDQTAQKTPQSRGVEDQEKSQKEQNNQIDNKVCEKVTVVSTLGLGSVDATCIPGDVDNFLTQKTGEKPNENNTGNSVACGKVTVASALPELRRRKKNKAPGSRSVGSRPGAKPTPDCDREPHTVVREGTMGQESLAERQPGTYKKEVGPGKAGLPETKGKKGNGDKPFDIPSVLKDQDQSPTLLKKSDRQMTFREFLECAEQAKEKAKAENLEYLKTCKENTINNHVSIN